MEVDTLMLADGSEAVGGKVYILGGGWNTIWAGTFPLEHRMSVTVGLRIGWNETNEQHALSVRVLTEDGQSFQEIAKAEFEAGRPPGLRPGSEQVIIFAINCTLKLEEPRELQMMLTVDEQDLKAIPFRVVARPTPPNVKVG